MFRFAGAALAAASLALGTQPAAAEVKEAAGDHFVVRGSVDTNADARATWLSLISPSRWWDKAHTWSGDAANLTLTPQGGGCFCERIPEDNSNGQIGLAGSAQHMVVLQAEPMAVLRMRGGLGPLQSEPAEGVLTITLKRLDGGGTRVAWEYVVAGYMRYETPVIAKAVDGVLGQQFGRLADSLGRAPSATPAPAEAGEDPPAAPAADAGERPPADDPAAIGDALDAMADSKAGTPK
jgi:hypothetical protein